MNRKVLGGARAKTQANEKANLEMSFLSSKMITFFACQSDVKVLAGLLETCLTGIYTGLDSKMSCPCCSISIETEKVLSKQKRNVELHTLHYGSITISVTDIRCRKFPRLLPCDGAEDAVFCVSKQDTFTRELLDAWVYDVCGMGGAFRNTFSSWMTKASMSSTEFHRLLKVPTLNLQQDNGDFTTFHTKLRFPRKEYMYRLFSYNRSKK